jgi:hypothetical protein
MKTWHFAHWPALAWVETILKSIAFLFAYLAAIQALNRGDFGLPGGSQLAQFIILAILWFGLLAAVYDRLLEREITAMIFLIFNDLAHGSMLLALASPSGLSGELTAFAGLMLLGDLVKLVFLRVHNFQVRDTPPAVMYALTGFYVVGYALLLLFSLLT